jgi:molybdate transport system substrate-binding protein
MSELINLAGIDILGPLPASIQHLTVISGGIAATSHLAAAARRVLEYMSSPGTADLKRRFGMDVA